MPRISSFYGLVIYMYWDDHSPPPNDAKRLVHESRAWADRRELDDEFHEVLEVELRTEVSGA